MTVLVQGSAPWFISGIVLVMISMTGKFKPEVVLLGTGTPNAEVTRSGPSVAVVAGGEANLVDFGPGVVRRARAAYESGIPALEPAKLTRAFVTHLHSDHTAGYPDLILTPWTLDRAEPLEVYGPVGIKEMTDHIHSAYEKDIRERVDGLQPSNDTGWRVKVHEIEEGVIFENEFVRVEAFKARHGSFNAFSFRFHAGDRVITVSGDTSPHDGMIDVYRGSDVLIHEVYSTEGFKKYSPEWQRYHSAMHTSSTELAKIASEVKPGLLVLYHQLYNGVTDEALLEEIRRDYSGEVVSGKDLDVF